MPTAECTRADVKRVKDRDAAYGSSQDLLAARMVAVIEARRVHARREAGAIYAYRSALVDLAAVSESLAADLPSRGKAAVTYRAGEHESICHLYVWPHKEQALCGWRPPHTNFQPDNPMSGPVPLTSMVGIERCPRCLDLMEPDAEKYSLMPPEDWVPWEDPEGP